MPQPDSPSSLPRMPSLAPVQGSLVSPPELDLAFNLEMDQDLADLAPHDVAADLIRPDSAEDLWTVILRQWLGALAPLLSAPLKAPTYSLGLSLVDDALMANLNAAWRQGDGPTDVLAFAAQEDAPPLPDALEAGSQSAPLELGDIVISLDTAKRQANEALHSLEHELLFLASHGLLHLLGWDHPDERSLAEMLALQDDLLADTTHFPKVTGDSEGERLPR